MKGIFLAPNPSKYVYLKQIIELFLWLLQQQSKKVKRKWEQQGCQQCLLRLINAWLPYIFGQWLIQISSKEGKEIVKQDFSVSENGGPKWKGAGHFGLALYYMSRGLYLSNNQTNLIGVWAGGGGEGSATPPTTKIM